MTILIINQPNSGDPVDVEIDKNEVKLIPKVASDPVYSQESNWNLVTAEFKHDSSNRRLYTVLKDLTQHELMALKPQMLGGDKFEINKLLISKADRSHLVVRRSEIPSYANYDFTLKTSGPASQPVNWTYSSSVVPFGANAGLQNTGTAGWNQGAYAQGLTGDFVIQYNLEITQRGGGIGDIMFGYSKSQPVLNGSFPNVNVYVDSGSAMSSINGFLNYLSGNPDQGSTFIFIATRVGGLITYSCSFVQGGTPHTVTGTIESSYTGVVYPHVLIYNTGAKLLDAFISN